MSKKRQQHSAEFKLETVMEGFRGEKPIAQLCRERNITDSLYFTSKTSLSTHLTSQEH